MALMDGMTGPVHDPRPHNPSHCICASKGASLVILPCTVPVLSRGSKDCLVEWRVEGEVTIRGIQELCTVTERDYWSEISAACVSAAIRYDTAQRK